MTFKAVASVEKDPLEKLQADIERRQLLELRRRPRIFDPKVRTIGIDVEALDKLVADRKARENVEVQRNKNLDMEALQHSRILTELNRTKNRATRERNLEYQMFRDQYQKRDQTRDFDLNDPNALKQQQPPRINDTDELPASSLQMFCGEDIDKHEREKQQKRQVMQWANASIQDKLKREEQEKQNETCYGESVLAIDDELERLQLAKNTNTKSKNVETRLYNERLADLVAARRKADHELEQELGKREQEKNHNDDMLNERHSTTKRTSNPQLFTSSRHSYVPWHFKGYSAAEKQSILDAQAEQVAANDERHKQEILATQKFEAEQNDTRRELLARERARHRNKIQHNVNVAHTQAEQRQEFKKRYDFINQVVYQNPLDDYVFNCYGTITR